MASIAEAFGFFAVNVLTPSLPCSAYEAANSGREFWFLIRHMNETPGEIRTSGAGPNES
jgi:hypothetical protein